MNEITSALKAYEKYNKEENVEKTDQIKESFIKSLKNMKVILGNGFDLYCGLKTKYQNYFDSRCELTKNIEQWKNGFLSIETYVKETVVNYKDFDSKVKLSEKVNVWFLLFYLYPSRKKDNWFDIERIMLNSLYNEPISDSFWARISRMIGNRPLHNLLESDYFLVILAYCINKYDKGEFTNSTFYNWLLKELNKFELDFGIYISSCLYDDPYNFTPKYSMNVVKFFNLITNDFKNICSVDTFNYTHFNDYIIQQKLPRNIYEVRNVNGNYKNPIFGIDSSNIDSKSEIYKFTKTFRRLFGSFFEDQYRLYKDNKHFDNLLVFGHSLNKQDYSYFFPIFDEMKITDISCNSKIIFAFNIYNDNRVSIINDLSNNIANIINAYETYYFPNRKEHRLLESLSAQKRILTYEI